MNPLTQAILSWAAGAAGSAVSNSPEAQAAIDRAKIVTAVVAVAATAVFLFYFVPRFESPIPRGWRR